MALVHAYCSLQDVRDQVSDKDGRIDTDLLEKRVNAVSRAVEDWTGCRFWKDETATVRTYKPKDCDSVKVVDIASLVGLAVQTRSMPGGSWSTAWTIDTDFELGPENADTKGPAYAWQELIAVGGKRFILGRFSSLRVTAIHGWSAVPEQVREATILKAVSLYRRKDAPFGVAGVNDFGPIRITRTDPDVLDLLRPFQRVMA